MIPMGSSPSGPGLMLFDPKVCEVEIEWLTACADASELQTAQWQQTRAIPRLIAAFFVLSNPVDVMLAT